MPAAHEDDALTQECKVEAKSAASSAQEQKEQAQAVSAQSEVQVKRKRGRPRKIVTEPTEPQVKRKRGRPRKIRVEPEGPRRGPGRPRKDPNVVKRQIAVFLSDEERSMLKEMALLWGCTVSQFLANLIRDTYSTKRYMAGYNQLSQDERAQLVSQRQLTKFITARREQTAMQRNIHRRMGLDRSLTNVMVIEAPLAVTQSATLKLDQKELKDGINVPGIYCKNLGDVWIVPYGQLYRVSVIEIIQYPCYASVLDYFAGKRIPPALLSDFIERLHDFELSSMGEKAVQERLARVYGTVSYPVKETFELKRREQRIAQAHQSIEQVLAQLSPFERSTLNHIFNSAVNEAIAYENSAEGKEDLSADLPQVSPPHPQAELEAEVSSLLGEHEVSAAAPEATKPAASDSEQNLEVVLGSTDDDELTEAPFLSEILSDHGAK